MSEFTVKLKNYYGQSKETIIRRVKGLRTVPQDVWLKNSPALGIIFLSLIYLLFAPKTGSLVWMFIFLIGLGYAVFAILYWKKDQDFNLKLSLTVLLLSVPLAGYEVFSLMMKKILGLLS